MPLRTLTRVPRDIDTKLVGAGGTLFSAPQLPQALAGSDGTNVHRVLRIMLEDITPTPLGESLTELNRFIVLSDLDRLPVSARAEWGHLLLDMLRGVPGVPEGHCKWRFRRLLDADKTHQLIVGAATRFDRTIQVAFTAYVQLRHHEVTTRTGRTEESSTLGVLLTPRPGGGRPWDTSTVRVHGDLEIPPEDLKIYSDVWNRAFEDGDVVDHDPAEGPPAPTAV
ncbi:hypothetical protein [Streptomyces sp. Ag109_G2-6]|uniref:hypothetical protein n=1 Tax=Streptomyces sp. Ag109_G2-6 TaxID=2485154 RepID=UPI000F4EEAB0|nr:hypothetical protein [Streptomyces sp. Ag109_G2-6]